MLPQMKSLIGWEGTFRLQVFLEVLGHAEEMKALSYVCEKDSFYFLPLPANYMVRLYFPLLCCLTVSASVGGKYHLMLTSEIH